MQIDVGYFYFIKDSFFDIIDDSELMKNKENGNKRPCYYCIKSKKYDNIIWFIPVSTKIDKYKRIYDSKIQKQIKLGKNPSIDTIVFGDVANTYSAFLIQNMFPVTLDYIESQYMKNKVPIKVSKHVIPTCVIKSDEDKFKNVFHILDGLLAIKLSIIPTFAKISHTAINNITIANLVSTIKTLFLFICLKYFFLSSDMFFSYMHIKLLPNSIKILTKFRTFPTIYRISIFHFKIYFMYFIYCTWSVCKNYYSI